MSMISKFNSEFMQLCREYADLKVEEIEAGVQSVLDDVRKHGIKVDVPNGYLTIPAKDYIKSEIEEFSAGMVYSLEDNIRNLAYLLPASVKRELGKLPAIIYAWMTLQSLKGTNLLYHKSAELGEFIYDSSLWTIVYVSGAPFSLHYNGPCNVPIDLPNGCINCHGMFMGVKFNPGSYLRKFDTSNVKIMSRMFKGCLFHDNFSLGESFDTSSVTSMESMFSNCTLSDKFSFGSKFTTDSLTDADSMFQSSVLKPGFKLPKTLDLTHFGYLNNVLAGATLPDGRIIERQHSNLKDSVNRTKAALRSLGATVRDV